MFRARSGVNVSGKARSRSRRAGPGPHTQPLRHFPGPALEHRAVAEGPRTGGHRTGPLLVRDRAPASRDLRVRTLRRQGGRARPSLRPPAPLAADRRRLRRRARIPRGGAGRPRADRAHRGPAQADHLSARRPALRALPQSLQRLVLVPQVLRQGRAHMPPEQGGDRQLEPPRRLCRPLQRGRAADTERRGRRPLPAGEAGEPERPHLHRLVGERDAPSATSR